MATTLEERYKRLLLAANVLLENHMDIGECFVSEDNDDDDYPTDSDGDRWYQDWWGLREAIRACEQADPETADGMRITNSFKWFDMVGDTTITRDALDSGKIVHTGWKMNGQDTRRLYETQPDWGVNVIDYFDINGRYIGRDDNGLEPTFAEATSQQ
jgi:hypothetical protein